MGDPCTVLGQPNKYGRAREPSVVVTVCGCWSLLVVLLGLPDSVTSVMVDDSSSGHLMPYTDRGKDINQQNKGELNESKSSSSEEVHRGPCKP